MQFAIGFWYVIKISGVDLTWLLDSYTASDGPRSCAMVGTTGATLWRRVALQCDDCKLQDD